MGEEGYLESDGECSGKLRMVFDLILLMIKQFAEDTDSHTLSAGAIFGIVLACIAGLLALIIIIVAINLGLHGENR